MALPIGFRERFKLFAATLPCSECIDDLPQTPDQRAAKKADYFFEHRTIICELKNLETDPSGKLRRLLAPLEKRSEWPRFYGAWELSKILRKFPDGAAINRAVFESTTTAINKAVADANRQIRATKQSFGLSNSGGFLVLANESIAMLAPNVIAHKVLRMLNKRTPHGIPQFPEINFVWMISEKHVTEIRPGLSGISSLLLRQDAVPDPAGVEHFVESIQPLWAKFHNVECHVTSGADIDEMVFQRNPGLEPKSSSPLTRQQLWRKEYLANPYLQHLTDRRLIRFGTRLYAQIAPAFLKGRRAPPLSETLRMMSPWTHFLEEVNRRGLDMNDAAPFIRQINRRFRMERDVKQFARLGRNDLCPCGSGDKVKNCCGQGRT